MTTRTIKLSKPFKLHQKDVAEIVLKEPTGRMYIALGEPRIVVHQPSGSAYFIEMPAVIESYLNQCVQHELGADVLGLLALEDAIALKDALFVFFSDATARRAAGK